MWRNCPPRYLRAELELLAPRSVLAIGRKTWETVEEVLEVEGTAYDKGFWRGTGRLRGRQFEVFFVNHPSYGNWRYSLPALITCLNSEG